MKKEYLGDSVYAKTNEYGQIVLTTENMPNVASNTIYLELEVYTALEEFMLRAREEREEHSGG